jgi:hypothetical protein
VKRLDALRPSPAMVVAVIALVVALGGSAYAATQIGTNQIKSNAITAAKIKSNAVTGAKIKNGAVTGSKINLSSVGTVPSATHATTADSATKATEATKAGEAAKATTATEAATADNALNFARYKTSGIVKEAAGPESEPAQVTVWTAGPFTATGYCEEFGVNEFAAWTTLTTSAAESSAATKNEKFETADFGPGDQLEIGFEVSGSGPEINEAGEGNLNEGFTAVSPDGQYLLNGISASAVHYFGADCAFFGEFDNAG